MMEELRGFVNVVNHDYKKPGSYIIIGFVGLLVLIIIIAIPIAVILAVIELWKIHYLAVIIPASIITIIPILGYYITKFVNGQPSNSEQIEVNKSL